MRILTSSKIMQIPIPPLTNTKRRKTQVEQEAGAKASDHLTIPTLSVKALLHQVSPN